jgi:glucose-1-phosphate thymidylyltransferase
VDRRVTVEKGAQIIGSVVRGPSIIGQNARVVNSYVGPFTSLYHDVVIEDSEIEHSIVLEGSQISGISSRIQDSLIGRNVSLRKTCIRPQALQLALGDYSDVGLL